MSNLSAGLDLTDLDQPVTRLGHGLANGVGTFGFTLSADNVGLTLLFGTLDNEASTLRILLSNLLLLNCLCELATEGHVCDGNIFQSNVEFGSSAGELIADALGDSLTLCDELSSIELGDDGFKDFVTDGREDTLVVVDTEVLGQALAYWRIVTESQVNIMISYLVNLWERLDNRTMQDTQCQANHLQILGSSRCGDVSRLCADIEQNSALQPGNQKMSTLADNLFFDTRQSIKNDCSRSTLNVEDGLGNGVGCDGAGNRHAVDEVEASRSGRHCELMERR